MQVVCVSCGLVGLSAVQTNWYRHIFVPTGWSISAHDRSVRCNLCSNHRSLSTLSADDDLVRVVTNYNSEDRPVVQIDRGKLREHRYKVAGPLSRAYADASEAANAPNVLRLDEPGEQAMSDDGRKWVPEIEWLRSKLEQYEADNRELHRHMFALVNNRTAGPVPAIADYEMSDGEVAESTRADRAKRQMSDFATDVFDGGKMVLAEKTGDMALDQLNVLLGKPKWLAEALKNEEGREIIKMAAVQIAKAVALQSAPDSAMTTGLSAAASQVTRVASYKIARNRANELASMMAVWATFSKMDTFDPEAMSSAIRARVHIEENEHAEDAAEAVENGAKKRRR